jgi:hypothetical protein
MQQCSEGLGGGRMVALPMMIEMVMMVMMAMMVGAY